MHVDNVTVNTVNASLTYECEDGYFLEPNQVTGYLNYIYLVSDSILNSAGSKSASEYIFEITHHLVKNHGSIFEDQRRMEVT